MTTPGSFRSFDKAAGARFARKIAASRTLAFSLLCSTALVSGAFATAAFAQSAALTPPPRPLPDENGVDIVTNEISIQKPELSLGDPAGPGIAHNRYWFNTFWSHDYAAYISATAAGNYTLSVSVGGKAYVFTDVPGFPHASKYLDGTTLTLNAGVYTFTGRDGTIVTFDQVSGWYHNGGVVGLANKITRPNGSTTTFTYGSGVSSQGTTYHRLLSVNNSYGYQLKYEYPTAAVGTVAWNRMSKVTAINNAVDYCSPTAVTCTFTQTWPSVSYSYTTSGSNIIETVTDPVGAVTTYTHTTVSPYDNRIIGVKNPGSSSDNIVIDYPSSANGFFLNYTGISGLWKYSKPTMDTNQITGPDGSLNRTITYDTFFGVVLSDTNAIGKTTSYTNDGYRITQVHRQEGDADNYVYDDRGNVTQITKVPKPGSPLANIVLNADYDATCGNPKTCNQPNWVKDALGRQTDFTYNSSTGLPLTVTAPADAAGVRPQTRITYSNYQAYYKNSSGSIVASGLTTALPTQSASCRTTASCTGSTDEKKTIISYGPQTAGVANNLNPVSTTISLGNGTLAAITASAYDSYGRVVTVDGPLSGTADTSAFFYDLAGQVTGTIDPDPDAAGAALFPAVKNTYRPDGQLDKIERGTVTAQSAAALSTTFSLLTRQTYSYDSSGRRTRSVVSDGATNYEVTDTRYDANGRVLCTMQRMDPGNWSTLPSSCSPTQTTGANGPDRVTYNYYDALDRVWKVTTGYGTGAAANEETDTFSDNGQIATRQDAENNLTTYEYDGHDRLVTSRFPVATKGAGTSSATDYEQVGYDAAGNVTSFTTRRGETLTLAYDNLDRLITRLVPDRAGLSTTHTRDVYFGYDLFGDLLYARFDSAGGEGITNAFNALGQQTSTTSNMDAVSRTLGYQYDVAGNRTRITHPDGNFFNYYRHPAGALNYADLNGVTASSLFSATRDAKGRLDRLNRWSTGSASWAQYTQFGYDPVSRLASLVQNPNATSYDATTTFTNNPASQFASSSRNNDVYAFTGNALVNRSYTASGLNAYSAVAGTSYGYDANGNLTSDGTNSYVYDVENRLVTRSGGAAATLRYDPLGRLYEVTGASGTRRFLYDGNDLVAEYNTTGSLLRRYVHADGAGDDPLVWFEGSGVTNAERRYLYADERGSIVAVTDASGNVTNFNSYDEYGIPGSNTGTFTYTGQVWLPELGMNYYKARMYSPTLGRFMQTDPIGYGDGMNMYAYVRNDPVNGVDPSGLDPRAGCVGADLCVVGGGLAAAIDIWVFGSRIKGGLLAPDIPAFAQSPYADPYGGDLAGEQTIVVTGRRRQQPKKDTSIAHCAGVAAWAHKGQILVDGLSAVPAGRVAVAAGRTLSKTAQFAISAAQMHGAYGSAVVSAVHGDLGGVGLSAAGYGTVVADAVKEGGSFIPGVGALIAVASIANDIFGSEEYKACREGK